MIKKTKMAVQLGEFEWKKYTYKRSADSNVQLLGSVRHGPQIGALGIIGGAYCQIVGDYVVPLNAKKAEHAYKSAVKYARQVLRQEYSIPAIDTNRPAPCVIVKRKRTFTKPDAPVKRKLTLAPTKESNPSS